MKTTKWLSLFLLFFLMNCISQENNTMTENPLLKNIKKYNDEPIYQIEVETIYNYDIWVNDILVLAKHNNVMNTFGTFDNSFILKSGIQKLKVKFTLQMKKKSQSLKTSISKMV